MRINTNIAALNSYNQLKNTQNSLTKSLQRLSSGKRINGASDDAAGLAISEKMKGQMNGLGQAQRNAQDGISMIQTAEGALKESHSILQRVRELTVQANNDTNTTTDLEKIQSEIDELTTELTDIAKRTEFNGKNLLDGALGAKTENVGTDLDGSGGSVFKITDVTGAEVGAGYEVITDNANDTITVNSADGTLSQTINSGIDVDSATVGDSYNFDKLGITLEATATDLSGIDGSANATAQFDVSSSGVSFQIGANANQKLDLSISDMKASALGDGTNSMDDIDVTDFSTTSFSDQLSAIDAAISDVSSERSQLGAKQNRLEHTINNLSAAEENLTAAESRISDVDMAKEMMSFTKSQILSQAGTAMMAQANQIPQGVLQLLG